MVDPQESDDMLLEKLFNTPPAPPPPSPLRSKELYVPINDLEDDDTCTVPKTCTSSPTEMTCDEFNGFECLFELAQSSTYNTNMLGRQLANFRLFLVLMIRSISTDLLPLIEESNNLASALHEEIHSNPRPQNATHQLLYDSRTLRLMEVVSQSRIIRDMHYHLYSSYFVTREQLAIFDEPEQVTRLLQMFNESKQYHIQ